MREAPKSFYFPPCLRDESLTFANVLLATKPCLRVVVGLLQSRDVELVHREHRRHHPARFLGVLVLQQLAEHGYPSQTPQGFNLMLPVDDIDAWWQRAVDAGATVVMPVATMFWGDRYGQLRDPFGVLWAMNQPTR